MEYVLNIPINDLKNLCPGVLLLYYFRVREPSDIKQVFKTVKSTVRASPYIISLIQVSILQYYHKRNVIIRINEILIVPINKIKLKNS